jgi:hypothetical protein
MNKNQFQFDFLSLSCLGGTAFKTSRGASGSGVVPLSTLNGVFLGTIVIDPGTGQTA